MTHRSRTLRRAAALAALLLTLALAAPPAVAAQAASAWSAPGEGPAAFAGALWHRLAHWWAGLAPAPPADGDRPTALHAAAGSSMDPNGTPGAGAAAGSDMDPNGGPGFTTQEGGDMDPNG
ncbi:MAG TPA: hypothetical protein VLF66_05185 [Thermoanaerobaculia bacterium]|nr:hypothetical protein [Thermoanaerobaculia bacterium]